MAPRVRTLTRLAGAAVAALYRKIPEEQYLALPEPCRIVVLAEFVAAKTFYGGRIPDTLLQVGELLKIDLNGRTNTNETLNSILESPITTVGELVFSSSVSGTLSKPLKITWNNFKMV